MKTTMLPAVCLLACFAAALQARASGPVPRLLSSADAKRIAELQAKGSKSGLTSGELVEIRSILKPAAEKGDVDAQIGMGNSYFNMHVGRDQIRGRKLPFKELAHTDYYYDYYYYGKGGGQKYGKTSSQDGKSRHGHIDEAEPWFRKAAESGSPRAMTSMAAVWTCRWFDKHYGKGDAAQEEEYRRNAAAWAEKAAENGSVAACYMLAEKLNNPSDKKTRKKHGSGGWLEGRNLAIPRCSGS